MNTLFTKVQKLMELEGNKQSFIRFVPNYGLYFSKEEEDMLDFHRMMLILVVNSMLAVTFLLNF